MLTEAIPTSPEFKRWFKGSKVVDAATNRFGQSLEDKRMLHALICVVACIFGAFGRRIAGGAFQEWTGLDIGDVPVRIFFGMTIGAAGLIAGLWWPYSLALMALTFVGSTIGDFGGNGMGRPVDLPTPPDNYWRDFLAMTAHGLLSVVLPTMGAWYLGYGWWFVLLSGLLCAPCYELGYQIAPENGWSRPGWPVWLSGATQFGEFGWGAILGLATALACLT